MGMYVADIHAIPDDKWNSSLGGCSRSASEITAEVASSLDWAANALKGEARAAGEEELAAEFKSRCATKMGGAAEIHRTASEFVEALGAASDDTLNRITRAPWGLEAPLFTIANVISSHIWYHDGQLNFIPVPARRREVSLAGRLATQRAFSR